MSRNSLGQLVITWTLHQPGITTALVVARSPVQALHYVIGANIMLIAEDLAYVDD